MKFAQHSSGFTSRIGTSLPREIITSAITKDVLEGHTESSLSKQRDYIVFHVLYIHIVKNIDYFVKFAACLAFINRSMSSLFFQTHP